VGKQLSLWRRRASLRYELEVNAHVRSFIISGDVLQLCPVCRERFPVELRRMGNGDVRNVPRCQRCRRTRTTPTQTESEKQ
jgi:hypothetical protein